MSNINIDMNNIHQVLVHIVEDKYHLAPLDLALPHLDLALARCEAGEFDCDEDPHRERALIIDNLPTPYRILFEEDSGVLCLYWLGVLPSSTEEQDYLSSTLAPALGALRGVIQKFFFDRADARYAERLRLDRLAEAEEEAWDRHWGAQERALQRVEAERASARHFAKCDHRGRRWLKEHMAKVRASQRALKGRASQPYMG